MIILTQAQADEINDQMTLREAYSVQLSGTMDFVYAEYKSGDGSDLGHQFIADDGRTKNDGIPGM